MGWSHPSKPWIHQRRRHQHICSFKGYPPEWDDGGLVRRWGGRIVCRVSFLRSIPAIAEEQLAVEGAGAVEETGGRLIAHGARQKRTAIAVATVAVSFYR